MEEVFLKKSLSQEVLFSENLNMLNIHKDIQLLLAYDIVFFSFFQFIIQFVWYIPHLVDWNITFEIPHVS